MAGTKTRYGSTWSAEAPQSPFDAAVIVPTTVRPSLAQAVRSVFAQDWAGRIQILIGLDVVEGAPALLETLIEECPERMAITVLDLGYSTSVAHGGVAPNPYGGNLRTILSFAANADRLFYLDDDNWWAPHHISDLVRAGDGFDWAYSYRWFVDGVDDRVLCVDDFESVGPGKGVFKQKFNGFVDTNCMMIDRSKCMDVLAEWSIPIAADGSGEDRRVLQALCRAHSVGWTRRPSVYYRVNAGRGVSPVREQAFRERGVAPTVEASAMDNPVARRRSVVEDYVQRHKVRKLAVGVGPHPSAGWLNTDLVAQHPDVFVMNAAKPFPFKDAVFDYVASEHMIEHLPLRDGMAMLRECFRVLKPGGRVRIATPDLRRFVGLFQPEPSALQKRYMDWITRTFLRDVRGSHPVTVLNNLFYNWGHRFIYDEAVLAVCLREAGFDDLQRYRPGESGEEELKGFEVHGKAIGDAQLNDFETMAIEGRKPG